MQIKKREGPRFRFSDTTPAAPEGRSNVKWQLDWPFVSAYVESASGDALISDAAYSAAWDGVTDVAPSKNAVYDKIESLSGGGNGNPYTLCVFPDINDFSLLNLPDSGAGASYGNSSNGILYLSSNVNAGGNSVKLFYQASPGASNTVTAAFHYGFAVPGGTAAVTGIWLYDTGSGKLIQFGFQTASGGGTPGFRMIVEYWTNSTTYSSEPMNLAIYPMASPLIWLRIVDNGSSTRSYHYSFDGVVFIQVRSEARTSHVTSPDSVGVGHNVGTSSGAPSAMSCASFTVE
jgi:hypothetical protein